MSKIITVSGMVGAGKTTFINTFAQYIEDVYHMPVARYLESVDNNELLNLMYVKPERWMFTSQVNFLADKVRSLRATVNNTEPIVLIERDFLEQLVFIEAQFTSGNIDKNEYQVYKDLYDLFKSDLPKVINYHIDADYTTCISHIRNRGRECEQLIDEQYYRILYNKYQKFYMNHPSKLIIKDTLDSSTYDAILKKLFVEDVVL